MSRPVAALGLAQGLARRLFPLAVAVGLLISIGIPLTYYLIDTAGLQQTATIYAEDLAARVGEFVFDTPNLWKYQAQKYLGVLHQFIGSKELISITILDEAAQPISDYAYRSAQATAWWNRDAPTGTAPIRFNSRQMGTVEVSLSRGILLRTSLILFALSAATGTGLAVLIHRFPVRVVYEMEADLKQAYNTLTRANTQLTAEVAERQRAEAALQATVRQLERSNRELQDFAYVASHDLQEPLRKIRAFGDRLKSQCAEALSARGRDYLERMQQAAARMQTLIEDLLTFSRVATKAQPFRAVDLAQVAREVMTDLEVRLEQVNGRVELDSLPTIDADPMQMRQLLQNLLGNALKFCQPETLPVVRLSSSSAPEPAVSPATNGAPAPCCQLLVEDNGIGFDEQYLDRIFVPFQRLHGRGEYEGTGIGLAICRKIAERHGGQITARSTPGKGATFIVTLPVSHPKGEHLA